MIRVGDVDRYVQGQQTYVIKYTQRDVTKSFGDTGANEFYWDTNGTGWQVPISQLNVSLTVDQSLAGSLTGQHACYVGSINSPEKCELAVGEGVYQASASNLSRGENITLALGFEVGTFAEYRQSWFEKALQIWLIVQGVLLAASLLIFVFIVVRYSNWSSRKKELGTVVAEYLPPKDSSVSLSGSVVNSFTVFAAQLIDLAVRHYIKIYEKKEAKLLSPAVYEFEIIKSIGSLREEEQEFLRDIFNGGTHVGAKVDTSAFRKDYKLSTRLADNTTKIKKLKREEYGLLEKSPKKSAWLRRWGAGLVLVGLVLLSPPLLVIGLVSFILSATLWVRTDKGLALYRYLEGLKLYISVAEEERLKMLQSPEGAQKVQTDANDPKKLVKLYERVLPYAILFGQEKGWNKQLGSYYESTGSRPDWYTGTNAAIFNAAAFSGAMSSLTTSINSSGASYSSSGGSSGGGFSGGGGGGGGGGGW